MYRQRNYKKTERIMIKGVAALNWFTGVNLDDPYKQGWKGRVRRKGQFKNKETKDEKLMRKKIPRLKLQQKCSYLRPQAVNYLRK